MLFITDKPVSMNELQENHRSDVEKDCARRCSSKDVEILSQSMETIKQPTSEPSKEKKGPRIPMVRGPRIRRHSSYEPNLDDILEDDECGVKVRERNRDLAEIHRERARNSGMLKHDRDGRAWRKKHFAINNNYSRPRSYTAWWGPRSSLCCEDGLTFSFQSRGVKEPCAKTRIVEKICNMTS